ncbi:ATP-binding protein [Mycoplasmoides pneumoniae]|uniref:ATP-binding protein n=1 Tax=Mycoplasmoides pneumoniae TaxID=2104 RepID=UPI0002F59264|nr:ATP-binding protein [Mycoplasmoides pneumoniae]ALA30500.1 uridylate kinase [Mycoplasmoides pneumoniae PI 1428]ALA33307.1 uridylate kinase [Mycoplasmoides pneumoniae 54089]ALA34010.1 uridylate kinase [Mycoplasmoides pneumoniae 54524]ALA34727.1 uridylate kinase [Mycoplasmoides pneumoniae 85084]ALA35429.1 uridylate kinase [Mycoplasmoides pneumoniae 85138]
MRYLDLNIKSILADWEIADAIRELIANAIDEHRLSNTAFPVIELQKGFLNSSLVIKDYGRGIKSNHFIQNESREKVQSEKTIGKFGIGLKDAIAVLFRHNVKVSFTSSEGTFTPVERMKEGMKDGTKTIQITVDETKKIDKGTDILISKISRSDYEKAIAIFLELRTGYQKLASSKKGDIYRSENGSEIFLNGMKIGTDENFLFSYDIKEPNKKLQKSLNRERKTLSRDSYRDNIISILKSSINKNTQTLINQLIDNRDQFETGEWSFIDVKKLVMQNTNRKILWTSNESSDIAAPAYQTWAQEEGYEIISIGSSQYQSMENDAEFKSYTLNDFGDRFVNEFQTEEVPFHKLTEIEKDNWNWVMAKVKELTRVWSNWKNLYKHYEFSIIKKHPNAEGLHSNGRIQIVRKILNERSHLFNTIMHEICHATSFSPDVSQRFEQGLTSAFYPVMKLKPE